MHIIVLEIGIKKFLCKLESMWPESTYNRLGKFYDNHCIQRMGSQQAPKVRKLRPGTTNSRLLSITANHSMKGYQIFELWKQYQIISCSVEFNHLNYWTDFFKKTRSVGKDKLENSSLAWVTRDGHAHIHKHILTAHRAILVPLKKK